MKLSIACSESLPVLTSCPSLAEVGRTREEPRVFTAGAWSQLRHTEGTIRACEMAGMSEADIFDDDVVDESAQMSTEDLLVRSRLLDNEIRVLKVWSSASFKGTYSSLRRSIIRFAGGLIILFL
jgi:hypothetical protein